MTESVLDSAMARPLFSFGRLFQGRVFDVGCTIDVEHTSESLHAYVDLDGDIDMRPGDQVIVHGPQIKPAFGARIVERRRATVIRASLLGRLFTKLTAGFELNELYEVSFTSRRDL